MCVVMMSTRSKYMRVIRLKSLVIMCVPTRNFRARVLAGILDGVTNVGASTRPHTCRAVAFVGIHSSRQTRTRWRCDYYVRVATTASFSRHIELARRVITTCWLYGIRVLFNIGRCISSKNGMIVTLVIETIVFVSVLRIWFVVALGNLAYDHAIGVDAK